MYDSLKSIKHYIIMLLITVFCPTVICYSQTEILIQAELADTIKTGTIDNNDQGFTGTGFVNLDNKTGTYVVWMINLPSSGTYNVTVRYANGSTDRTMNIYVNHVLKISSFNFTSTGSWTTWQTMTFQLYFLKGVNHLKFEGSNPNSGPSLDYIVVSSPDHWLSIDPEWIVLPSSSGSKGTINITSNISWTASENADWFKLSPSSGTGNGTVTVTTTSANASPNPRMNLITFSATGVNPVTVRVEQAGTDPFFEVYPLIIFLEASSGTTGTINIKSNSKWTVSKDADWISLLISDGGLNSSITVKTTSANTSAHPRSTLLTFVAMRPSGSSFYQYNLEVTQYGAAPTLSVKPLTITVESKAKAQATFNITSNTSWNVTKDADAGWINLSSSSGTGDGSITVETTSANPMAIPRTAEITFKADDVFPFIVEVIQSGAVPTLSVTPSSVTVGALSGATQSFNIKSNAAWDVSTKADWISLSVSSGTGNGTVTLTTSSANTSVNTRSANVTISVIGANPITLTVIQAGTVPTSVYDISGSGIVVYPNPVSGVLSIDYKDENVSFFKIINTVGSVISTEKAVVPVQQIDFSIYGQGLYILEFTKADGSIFRRKIMKH